MDDDKIRDLYLGAGSSCLVVVGSVLLLIVLLVGGLFLLVVSLCGGIVRP